MEKSWQLTVSAFLFLPGKFTLLSARVVLEIDSASYNRRTPDKRGKIVSGDIWMGEQNLIQLSEKEWCEVHGNKMGYIFRTRNSH